MVTVPRPPYSTSSHPHLEAGLTWPRPLHPAWTTPSLMEASCSFYRQPCLGVEGRLQLCFISCQASLVAQLVKNPPAMWETTPGLGRSPGEGKGSPLQYSGLENSTDRVVHGVAKSRTRLSDFHFATWISSFPYNRGTQFS